MQKKQWSERVMDKVIGFEDWVMENYNKYHKKTHMTFEQQEMMREIRIKLADKVKEGKTIDATIVEEILKEVEDLYENN